VTKKETIVKKKKMKSKRKEMTRAYLSLPGEMSSRKKLTGSCRHGQKKKRKKQLNKKELHTWLTFGGA
jgi:hypothetical protein